MSKLLYFNGYFLLPADFEGDLNDALRELIKYREESNLPAHPTKKGTEPLIMPDEEDLKDGITMYSNLMTHMSEGTGKRISYTYSISREDKDTNQWIRKSEPRY